VIFPLRHVTRKFTSPADVAQVLMPLARAGFPPLNFQASLEPETLTVKFTGNVDQAPAVIEFLRVNVAGFENCSTPVTNFTTAQRAGRMIVANTCSPAKTCWLEENFPTPSLAPRGQSSNGAPTAWCVTSIFRPARITKFRAFVARRSRRKSFHGRQNHQRRCGRHRECARHGLLSRDRRAAGRLAANYVGTLRTK